MIEVRCHALSNKCDLLSQFFFNSFHINVGTDHLHQRPTSLPHLLGIIPHSVWRRPLANLIITVSPFIYAVAFSVLIFNADFFPHCYPTSLSTPARDHPVQFLLLPTGLTNNQYLFLHLL